jgi:hypothetical protein
MNLQLLQQKPPLLHEDASGTLVNWQISESTLDGSSYP